MQKRYQYRGKGGEIMWTDWFTVRRKGESRQYKKLKNEYRESSTSKNQQS